MRHAKFIAYLVLVISFGGISVAYSGQMYQKHSFSITLPDGWKEIPMDVIDAYLIEISRLAPNAPKQDYDCGFQLDNAQKWFGYPYILVSIKNTGRIPENELGEFARYSVLEDIDKYKKPYSSIISSLQAGKMYYDKQSEVIRVTS